MKSSYWHRQEDLFSIFLFAAPGPYGFPGKTSKIIRTGDFFAHEHFRGETWYHPNRKISDKHRAREPRNLTHELSHESAHENAHGSVHEDVHGNAHEG